MYELHTKRSQSVRRTSPKVISHSKNKRWFITSSETWPSNTNESESCSIWHIPSLILTTLIDCPHDVSSIFQSSIPSQEIKLSHIINSCKWYQTIPIHFSAMWHHVKKLAVINPVHGKVELRVSPSVDSSLWLNEVLIIMQCPKWAMYKKECVTAGTFRALWKCFGVNRMVHWQKSLPIILQ